MPQEKKLVWLGVLVMFGLPAYIAFRSTKNCVSKSEALLLCNACKMPIPATATVCPVCQRRAGHDVYSAKGKKLYYNIKSNRFLRTYLYCFVTEVVVIPAIIMTIMVIFKMG